jgi:DNA-binding NarL/FixJ family response regulator
MRRDEQNPCVAPTGSSRTRAKPAHHFSSIGKRPVTRQSPAFSQRRRKGDKRRPRTRKGGKPMLTPREVEVLRLLSCGCSYAMIGVQLGVSANTVTSHIKNAYRKLEVHTAAAAVMRAVELRLLGQS